MKIIFLLPDNLCTEIPHNWEYPCLPRVGDFIQLSDFIPQSHPEYNDEFYNLMWNVADIRWLKVSGETIACIGLGNEISNN